MLNDLNLAAMSLQVEMAKRENTVEQQSGKQFGVRDLDLTLRRMLFGIR